MALALAQTVKINATSGTSVTVNSAMTFAAGSLAVGGVSCFQGTGSNFAASDSSNGSYTMLTAQDVGDPAVRLGYKANTNAATVNLTANGGASANGVVGIFMEITGADTTAPFTTGEQAGGTGTSTAPDTGAVTNATADSIYVGIIANASGTNPATMTINATGTEGTWVRDATNGQQLDGSNYPVTSTVTQIVASGAARSHTWTAENVAWATAVACFKMAAGGAATPIYRRGLLTMGMG